MSRSPRSSAAVPHSHGLAIDQHDLASDSHSADILAFARGDAWLIQTLTRYYRSRLTREINKLRHAERRPIYYEREKLRRQELAAARRVGRRHYTENPCPAKEQLLEAWVKAKESWQKGTVHTLIMKTNLFWLASLTAAMASGELKNGTSYGLGEVPAEIVVERRAGEPVRFSLAANPTTGYQWDAEWNPSECDLSLEYRAPGKTNPPTCGAGGETEVVVTSKIYTPARIELRYRRPWEKDEKPWKAVRLIVYTVGEAKDPCYPLNPVNRLLKSECEKRGITLVDYHLHIRGGMTPELAYVRETNSFVRSSAMENHGREWEIFDNAKLRAFAARARKANPKMPVGIQVNDRDWFEQIDAETRAQFDYILADSMIMGALPSGRANRLWMVQEIPDPEKWMEAYFAHVMRILDEPISIYANATYIPTPIAGLYDQLWTEDRKMAVIRKCVEKNIAIEIQAESPFPTFDFLRLAKEHGAKFSFGTNNFDPGPKDLTRWLDVITSLNLGPEDLWSGKPVTVASDYFCEKTGLYMNARPEQGEPAASFDNGFMPWTPEKGYGAGMEDSAILNGIALIGLTARGDLGAKLPGASVAQGLLNLATVHGVKGFVARGICPEDGRSVCTLTSRDQITHFVHGLWRYAKWSRAKDDVKAKIGPAFADLADRMLANVTPENDYNALMADGQKDPKGILKMWEVRPHEAARLPMIYLAAAEMTGKAKYRAAYEKYIDAALAESLKLGSLSKAELQATMPGYAFLQMACSLDLLYGLETREDRRERIKTIGDALVARAKRRFEEEKGADGPWLSASGDLALALLIAPAHRQMLFLPDLFYDCLHGRNGQPDLKTTGPARQLSFDAANDLLPEVEW